MNKYQRIDAMLDYQADGSNSLAKGCRCRKYTGMARKV